MTTFTLAHRKNPNRVGVAVDRVANWVPIVNQQGIIENYLPQILIGVLWQDSRTMEYIDTQDVEWLDVPGYTDGDDEESPDETEEEDDSSDSDDEEEDDEDQSED